MTEDIGGLVERTPAEWDVYIEGVLADTSPAVWRCVMDYAKDRGYLQQAEAHADEGPLGEPAARSILKIALRQVASIETLLRTQADNAKRIADLEDEARRFADFYPQGSDGRNTFIIFADKIAALKGSSK